MTGISLDGLDISATQFQLVGYTCMTQAVKYHIRQSKFIYNVLHLIPKIAVSDGKSKGSCHYQIIILIFISQGFLDLILFRFQFHQTLCNRSWNVYFAGTAVCLWCFQHSDRPVIFPLAWKYHDIVLFSLN